MKRIIEIFEKAPSILILGFGKEGNASYRFIRKFFPDKELCIADMNSNLLQKYPFLKNDAYTEIHSGNEYLKNVEKFDLIIKSPGVWLEKNLKNQLSGKITSQTNLLLRFFSKQIIGISGTKGKSTTSSLIHHILSKSGIHSILAGNIGTPPFDIISEIKSHTNIVMELSAHQLENISTSPHIAVLLNLFEEHLDYFKNSDSYFNSKLNIATFQTNKDYFIYEYENLFIARFVNSKNINSQIKTFSINSDQANYSLVNNTVIKKGSNNFPGQINSDDRLSLKGRHNLKNILSAIACCDILKTTTEKIFNGIKSFPGLEHRLEYIGRYGEVDFYNDSISTIPESTIEAIESIKNTDTLILGGFDRGLSYQKLTNYLINKNISNIICYGQAGKRIFQALKDHQTKSISWHYVEKFRDIKRIIETNTKKGQTCLLSPAAASYDQFSNFEERGQVYKKIARSISLPAIQK